MKFYEKLILLRREKGFSQEQLADLLGISRQAVSKWESGNTLPDTEKLIALADLFGTSIDYLLRDNTTQREQNKTVVTTADNVAVMQELADMKRTLAMRGTLHQLPPYEYKSKAHIGSLPLVHIKFSPYGFAVAKGVIAIGNIAVGGLAFGGISIGVLALGGIGAGLFALGGIALGGLVLGGFGIGVVAFGGAAIGVYAYGGGAVALELAIGGAANGRVAIGGAVNGQFTLQMTDAAPASSAEVKAFVLQHANLPGFVRQWLGGA